MTARLTFSALFGLSLVGAALPARADRVPPPPKVCPPGARGETDHNGPHCAPTTCTSDETCGPGGTCMEQPLCIFVEHTTNDSGWMQGEPLTRLLAKGVCGAGDACRDGAKCEKAMRCVTPDSKDWVEGGEDSGGAKSTPPEVKPRGCGCSVPGGEGGLSLGLAGACALCAAAVLRRRRAGSPTRSREFRRA